MRWVGPILLIALSGCASVPPGGAEVHPVQTAEPSATPAVEAGDNARIWQEVRQSLTQIQHTLTTVTTNYALDEERAKLERARQRDETKERVGGVVAWIGIALLFFAMPTPVQGQWRAIIITVALAMVAGGNVLPMVWPW